MKKLLYLTLALVSLIAACEKKTDPILNADQYARVLAEIKVVQKLNLPQGERLTRIQKILRAQGVTHHQLKKTTEYYSNNADFWIDVFKKSQEILKEKEKNSYAPR